MPAVEEPVELLPRPELDNSDLKYLSAEQLLRDLDVLDVRRERANQILRLPLSIHQTQALKDERQLIIERYRAALTELHKKNVQSFTRLKNEIKSIPEKFQEWDQRWTKHMDKINSMGERSRRERATRERTMREKPVRERPMREIPIREKLPTFTAKVLLPSMDKFDSHAYVLEGKAMANFR
jgi:hypothetical protein